jgi:hypothetical protein
MTRVLVAAAATAVIIAAIVWLALDAAWTATP